MLKNIQLIMKIKLKFHLNAVLILVTGFSAYTFLSVIYFTSITDLDDFSVYS